MVFGEAPDPVIADDQVLIQVRATSVNKPDIVQRQGNYAPPPGESAILGLEVAGDVVAVGSAVRRWSVGDRVIALVGGGGYAEKAVAYEGHCMPLPETMSYNQGACICETYITAYLNLFRLASLQNGESVLIHGGGGGVNTAAIHICTQLIPNSELFVTASSGKVDRVKDLGVHHVIDYQNQSFSEYIKNTPGKSVNVILDHLGASYLADNMKALAVGGRLVIIGVTGGIKAEINLALMMVKRQQVIGSVLRSRSIQEKSEIIQDFNNRVMPLFAESKIEPLIYKTMRLDAASDAHRLMESSQHFGKIVLEV